MRLDGNSISQTSGKRRPPGLHIRSWFSSAFALIIDLYGFPEKRQEKRALLRLFFSGKKINFFNLDFPITTPITTPFLR